MANTIYPLFVVVLVFIVGVLINNRISSNFDYQCGNCGEVLSVSTMQAMFVPHSMGRKLLKCPKCGHTTWATPVPKGDGS
jgi:ribosomal protein S27AE